MPVTVIKGPEELTASRAFTALRRQALTADSQLEEFRIDADSYTAGVLLQAAAPTLFGGGKLIYVAGAEQMSTAFAEDIDKILQIMSPDIHLVVRYSGGNRGKKVIDTLAKAGQVVDCPAIKSAEDKLRLVMADVRAAGRQITQAAAQALVDALGSDLLELAAVTNQIIGDISGRIDAADVERYSARRVEASGFKVADAAIAGNVEQAMALVRHALRTSGTNPVTIVAALAMKLRAMALVADGGPTSMAPWQRQTAQRDVRRWKENQLAEAIMVLAAVDEEVKGASLDPEFAVERAVRIVATYAAK